MQEEDFRGDMLFCSIIWVFVHMWYIKMYIRASAMFFTPDESDIGTINVCHTLLVHLFFHFYTCEIYHSIWFSCQNADFTIWLSTVVFTCYQNLNRCISVGFPVCTLLRKMIEHVGLLTHCFIGLYICIIHTNLKYSK